MTYGPYKIQTATIDKLTGEGSASFRDGEEFTFRVRTTAGGKRKYLLLTPRHQIVVCSPPRLNSVIAWVSANVPETVVIAGPAAPQKAIPEALDAADAFIAKMPAARDMKHAEWQRKLAALIDEAHDLSLPNEVVDPLRASSQAMSENLLAAE